MCVFLYTFNLKYSSAVATLEFPHCGTNEGFLSFILNKKRQRYRNLYHWSIRYLRGLLASVSRSHRVKGRNILWTHTPFTRS